ncbi:MAG: alpha/beta fold hydrolase [Actinomycetota bacterium]
MSRAPGSRYEVTGEGKAIVLSHSALGDRRIWDPQIGPLSERYRAVRFDARGFGLTTTAGDGSTFERHADLLALLDDLSIERATLIGASLGGRVSIDFTLLHPERVRSLVLVGSALEGYRFTDERVVASWKEEEAAYEAGDLERLTRNEMQTWLAGFDRPLEEIDSPVRDLVNRMLLDAYALPEPGSEQRLQPAAADRLGEISAPALVIVGDRDAPDIMRIADLLAYGIAGARKVIIEDTAHAPNLERPEEFNRIVLDFLTQVHGADPAR